MEAKGLFINDFESFTDFVAPVTVTAFEMFFLDFLIL